VNQRLELLAAYPFERLARLKAGITPPASLAHIAMSIGEPKHAPPQFVIEALRRELGKLDSYPVTAGLPEMRAACAAWLERRFKVRVLPESMVLPVNGTREALFSFVQAVVNTRGTQTKPVVAMPNPFYQIYEGATLLAGALPVYLNVTAENDFRPDTASVPEAVWRDVRLLYVCSPGNPTGTVLSLEDWRHLFALSDRHGFVIASDECYSELYYDEKSPPVGALQAAAALGRDGFPRLAVFSSLSKRSNAPGMRSGYVAGDAALLKSFLLYRTYHGSAMSVAVQRASIAAWADEAHVRENRKAYAEKYRAVLPLVQAPLETRLPQGGFYLWVRTPIDECEFTRRLHRDYNVLVLPGSYLAREANGGNPGKGYVRVALVAPLAECVEAVSRIARFASTL